MLKDMQLTHGIGVRIAHSTLRLLTKDVLIDQVLTFVTNVKQKKPTEHVPHKPKIPIFHNRDMLSPTYLMNSEQPEIFWILGLGLPCLLETWSIH
ncbi:hypothetical protein MUP77_19855 [Candidatus Bathyarchaeota archaeon]|nr:hypothetical protein [Candidatus Bathyarchaeota archaeon]